MVLRNLAQMLLGGRGQRIYTQWMPYRYPDGLILSLAKVKAVLKLTYRDTMAQLKSLLPSRCANYRTIYRRICSLHVDVPRIEPGMEIAFAVDGTGLSVGHGGEWLRAKHGEGNKMAFIKFHIGINLDTDMIVSCVITEYTVHDSQCMKELVEQAGRSCEIGEVPADGGYDTNKNFQVCYDKGIKSTMKVRVNSRSDTGRCVVEFYGNPVFLNPNAYYRHCWRPQSIIMGAASKIGKAVFMFIFFIPGTTFLYLSIGYFDELDRFEDLFFTPYTDPFLRPDYFLSRLSEIKIPDESTMSGLADFPPGLVLLVPPAIAIMAALRWTVWGAGSPRGLCNRLCPVCEKKSGKSSNYTSFTLYTDKRKVGRIQVHHGCFVEGAKFVGEQALKTHRFASMVISTKIGRKEFVYNMAYVPERKEFGIVETVHSNSGLVPYNVTIKFFRQYVKDDNVWFLYNPELSDTSGSSISRLVHVDDVHYDIKSMLKDPEYRSRVDSALKEYKEDLKARGSDPSERLRITKQYVINTAILA